MNSPTLTPFATGYADAIRASLPEEHRDAPFADETLALIIADCESYRGGQDASDGPVFWFLRQERLLKRFPPQTPSLGDDGKVYLREAV